jgi:hypothetical protein
VATDSISRCFNQASAYEVCLCSQHRVCSKPVLLRI